MSHRHMRPFRVAGLLSAALFAALLMLRMDVFSRFSSARSIQSAVEAGVASRESWMTIHQGERRIGHAFSRLSAAAPGGYALEEKVRLRLTTMGMVHDLSLGTEARLHPDLTLDSFRFEIRSGRFRFTAWGTASGDAVSVTTESAGDRRSLRVPTPGRAYPLAAIVTALGAAELKAGDRHVFDVFDLATLSHVPVQAEIVGPEEIELAGGRVPATRATLAFKSTIQTVWLGEGGELLKERGLLGMRLEKSSREEALGEAGLVASEDLTDAASVPADRAIDAPAELERLRVRLHGVRAERLQLHGGRQEFRDGVLTVRRESLDALPGPGAETRMSSLERVFLRPEPFIQSDHEKIRALADEVLGGEPLAPLEKARRLMDWVHRHIRKRPVLSLPDALSTLEQREGDCNEHAMLYAALARAAGLPARVEAGLAYLNGRFYYHAWNLVHVGRWVTVDAALGQLPADATHLRLVTGSANQQLDLAGLIGRVSLEILD